MSARYRLDGGLGLGAESQSSSGVIVSTGAGSTGWLSSVFTMATQVAALTGGAGGAAIMLPWEDEKLVWDGMEADSLHFNSGVTVEVRPAEQRAQLVA